LGHAKDSAEVPACVIGKNGETFAGEAKEALLCIRKITKILVDELLPWKFLSQAP